MTERASDGRRFRMLALFLSAGTLIFVGGLFVTLSLLGFAGVTYDPSILEFYPFMAALGAVFGFERWWSNEVGPYNPFRE